AGDDRGRLGARAGSCGQSWQPASVRPERQSERRRCGHAPEPRLAPTRVEQDGANRERERGATRVRRLHPELSERREDETREGEGREPVGAAVDRGARLRRETRPTQRRAEDEALKERPSRERET